MKERLRLKGTILIERRRKDGSAIDREEIGNLILTLGKSRVRDLIGDGIGTGLTGFSYIAIGLGETGDTVVVGDASLKNEVTRELATVSSESTNKVTFEKTFEFGTGEEYDITEAGVSDSAVETGSTLLNRGIFGEKSVDSDIDLYIKVTITVA